ncbi:unnamed protein product [Soboliphyme baturini]|uniref:Uncharacterized protein n=1 Tax=Soboliphyme baturini TaxID=241478 RepID=A0A183I9G9_9BILA|nr:unnamed protein product [Soboliphyme baturini]
MQNAVLEDDPRSPTVGIHRTPIEVTPTSKMGAASNSVLENSSSEDPNESPMAAYQKNPVRPSENLHREVLEASLFPKFSAQMSSTAEPTAARS